jgi:hypothetical protein
MLLIILKLKKQNEIKRANGSKDISLVTIRKLFLECLPEYCGQLHYAKSGSDYLNFYGKVIRFSDHERPYDSKWNIIHGLISKDEIIKFLNNLTKNELDDNDKKNISDYFDKL